MASIKVFALLCWLTAALTIVTAGVAFRQGRTGQAVVAVLIAIAFFVVGFGQRGVRG